MNRSTHARVYRALIRAYPKDFRENYGDDAAAIFSQQLDDLGPGRCWLRTTRDLIVTVPTQRLEQHMKQSNTMLFVGSLGVAIAATAVAVIGGTSMYALILLLVAAGAGVVAFMTRHAAQSADALERTTSWKRFLVSGGVLLAVMIVLMNLPANQDKELSSGGWMLMMAVLVTSFTLIGVGVVLAAVRRFGHHG